MNALDMQIMAGAMTIIQEAGNQKYKGKLAVAYVITNSCAHWNRSITDEVFKSYRYSCWLTGSPTLMNLDLATDQLVAECTKAMLAAWYKLEPDPTDGAVFYLNEKVVMAQAGKLPAWWEIDTEAAGEVVIGAHTFRPPRGKQRVTTVEV